MSIWRKQTSTQVFWLKCGVNISGTSAFRPFAWKAWPAVPSLGYFFVIAFISCRITFSCSIQKIEFRWSLGHGNSGLPKTFVFFILQICLENRRLHFSPISLSLVANFLFHSAAVNCCLLKGTERGKAEGSLKANHWWEGERGWIRSSFLRILSGGAHPSIHSSFPLSS